MCKGKYGYKFLSHPDRLKTPLIKDEKFVKPLGMKLMT